MPSEQESDNRINKRGQHQLSGMREKHFKSTNSKKRGQTATNVAKLLITEKPDVLEVRRTKG